MFTVISHVDVLDPDKYRIDFGKLRVGIRKLPGESSAMLWSRVLDCLADLQAERINKRILLWHLGVSGPLLPHAYIHAQEHAVDAKLKERIALAEVGARAHIRGDKPNEGKDKASLLRMLVDIGEHHPDGMTRVRALCRAADFLGMNAPKAKGDPSNLGVMLVPVIAEIAEWEQVAVEAQVSLSLMTRMGPLLGGHR